MCRKGYQKMKINKFFKELINIILIFMYIFMFTIYGFIDSSIVAGCIAFFLVITNYKSLNILKSLVCTKKFIRIILAYCCILIWIVLVLLINQSNDISFIKTFFHGLIQIIIGIIIFAHNKGRNSENNITNYIIISFFIQTLIEWGALISPNIKNFLYFTKDINTIAIADRYSGIRGLSLSGSSFFGLAVAFGFVYIIYISKKNTLFQHQPVYRTILYIVLISGTFFAGRTGLISIIFVICYKLYKWVKHTNKINIKYIMEMLIILIVLSIIVFLLFTIFNINDLIGQKLIYLKNYVFESFISFSKSASFSTTSTAHLFDDMYFKVNLKTLIVGDGMYNVLGGYYMNTDAGYMRVILYMGIPGLIMLIILQKYILKYNQVEKNIYYLLWFFLFVSQVKGEVIGFSLLTINMLTLFSLQKITNN